MSWFKRRLERFAYRFMEMLPDGRRRWQASLDEAMKQGQWEWGPSWDGPEFDSGLSSDPHDVRKAVFQEWARTVDFELNKELWPMIDDYVESKWGFRPYETKRDTDIMEHESLPVDVPSVDDLESWWK